MKLWKSAFEIAIRSVMNVSRSGFYDWKRRPKKNQDRLIVDIKSIHRESRGTYGVPRISIKLKEMGHTAGRQTYHSQTDETREYLWTSYPSKAKPRKQYRSPKIAREDLVRQNFTAESSP